MSICSAAVLISGSGTNLQAFIDETASGKIDLELSVVLSNRPDAAGLERARKADISIECLRHQDYPERAQFDAALVETLDKYAPDLVILAGFMRVLTATFVDHFRGRILNIHPSLLPKFPGLDTHRRALDAGEKWHGSTVHFVTGELDGGPALIQGRVPVRPGDSMAELAARVLAVEHKIYPEAVRLFAAGRIQYRDGAAWFDGERLNEPLQYSNTIRG
ncbi:MAG: phosphoribosylglycinamide formyltransferase [Proteobacteria bacterium]|nr:phosphoribosylglycinamide formyltransferase [Pseudomonadota bacterium]